MLIDSHVNLHHASFDADRGDVIAAARAAGVGAMITICDRLNNLEAIRAIAHAHDDIHMSVGVHPHYAKDYQSLTAQTLSALAQDPKVVAIGETGLDRYYNHSPLEDQIACFKTHLTAASATELPVIVHTRDADALTAQCLEEAAQSAPLKILMHCYTSSLELARRAWALGGYISFSGIMTFKNAEDVRAVAREAPLDRVLLETDCPYLTPTPYRGQRNEPARVAEVYAAFAALRGLEPERLMDQVRANTYALFSRMSP